MKQLLVYIFAAASLMTSGSSVSAQAATAPGQSMRQIVVDGINRSYIVYLPKSYSSTVKAPLLFLFHGGGGHASSMLNVSHEGDFKKISERDNVILVAPDGIDKSWNDGRKTKSNKEGVDDVHFVSQLLQFMEANYAVDASRIYATGISNGGFMTSRLGCELGGKLAAIAVVAASMGVDTPYSSCRPSAPLPVLYIHGTADPIVAYNGAARTIGANGAFVSHQQVLDKWIALNHCTSIPVVTQLPTIVDDGTTVSKYYYAPQKDGAEVIGYTIDGGGHTWPGGTQYLPKMIVGPVSHNLNGCEVIWDFFKQHTRQ